MLDNGDAGVTAAGAAHAVATDTGTFADLIALAATILEALGVGVILGGFALVAVVTLVGVLRSRDWKRGYHQIRQRTGRVILLGLELLVGADIIRTVADHPTPRSVAVLAGVVLIRTFLSFTIEVELEGRWPWQRGDSAQHG